MQNSAVLWAINEVSQIHARNAVGQYKLKCALIQVDKYTESLFSPNFDQPRKKSDPIGQREKSKPQIDFSPPPAPYHNAPVRVTCLSTGRMAICPHRKAVCLPCALDLLYLRAIKTLSGGRAGGGRGEMSDAREPPAVYKKRVSALAVLCLCPARHSMAIQTFQGWGSYTRMSVLVPDLKFGPGVMAVDWVSFTVCRGGYLLLYSRGTRVDFVVLGRAWLYLGWIGLAVMCRWWCVGRLKLLMKFQSWDRMDTRFIIAISEYRKMRVNIEITQIIICMRVVLAGWYTYVDP